MCYKKVILFSLEALLKELLFLNLRLIFIVLDKFNN